MSINMIDFTITLEDGTEGKVIYSTLTNKVAMILVPSPVLGVRAMHPGDWHKDIAPAEWAYIKSTIDKELKQRRQDDRREKYFQLLRSALSPQEIKGDWPDNPPPPFPSPDKM